RIEPPRKAAGRTHSLRLREKGLATLKGFFRALSFLHVRNQEVPPDRAAVRVLQGKPADLEPAINTIKATKVVLHLKGFASLERRLHRGEHTRKFIWRDDVPSPPVVQGLQVAEKLRHSAVDLSDFTGWAQHSDLGRNAIDDQASLLLTLAELFLRLLPIVHIDDGPVPLHDAPVCVEQRPCVDRAPAIGGIRRVERANLDTVRG